MIDKLSSNSAISMISAENICANYGKISVLKQINMSVKQAGITAILGPNGSGKSTLLGCIARQMPIKSGKIYLNGCDITEFPLKEFAQKLSYLKQSRDIPAISVEGLVLHGRFPYMGFSRHVTNADKEIAISSMQKAGVFSFRHKMLSELSGGECQKAYIAMALCQNTSIMLLDEPTTYLDIRYQLELLELLADLRNEGKTIITVLHDINSALRISDKIYVMNNGAIAFCGTPSQLIETNILEQVFSVKTNCAVIDEKPVLAFNLL